MFRSLLFIPGNNPSMLQNADIFSCDAVIFDLEDAVGLHEKDNARNLVETFFMTNKVFPKQVILRVNPVTTNLINDDIQLLLSKKIDYILLPKANQASLYIFDQILETFEKKHGLDKTKIICLIEEAKAVLEVNEIAAHDRVEGLLLGAEDLTNELEVERTLEGKEIDFARSMIIFAASSHNIISIDTPYTDISNTAGLIEDSKHASSIGMKAKSAIHPNQIDVINDIFSPSKDLIDWAKEVVKIHEETGKSVFQFKGKMIDKPIIEKAQKMIEKAKIFEIL